MSLSNMHGGLGMQKQWYRILGRLSVSTRSEQLKIHETRANGTGLQERIIYVFISIHMSVHLYIYSNMPLELAGSLSTLNGNTFRHDVYSPIAINASFQISCALHCPIASFTHSSMSPIAFYTPHRIHYDLEENADLVVQHQQNV